jgi:hypothetical protein
MKDTRALQLLSSVSEKKWQETVIGICKARGYLVYHTHDSRRCEPGFPDLVIVGHKRVIFAELKTIAGKVEPEQQAWLDALVSARQIVFIWRPGDLEEINAVLG